MKIYNTLTKRVEDFRPISPPRVTIYTCGPTVYRDVHIGNLRTYLLADWLKRALLYLGYEVFHVKNITDVGHMRQELLERGEDKVIAAARAAGKTSREIARHYTLRFMEDEAAVNIIPADVHPRATEHIPQCIELIQRMAQRGHAYVADGNVYFDVTTFPGYGKLSGNLPESLLRGVRVDVDPLKRHPQDFALWKVAEPGREMKWDSPWGEGFPGWHIECSAMSLHYLGDRFDIHTGGVDNIFPHHEDEIAQSESAVGHEVVGCWVHGAHLLADGLKMAKSAGNDYTIRDVENRGFDPLSFRYLCLTAHYRTTLNFTFNALKAAQRGLSHLRRHVEEPIWEEVEGPRSSSSRFYYESFREAVEEDLALPRALALIWQMLHDPSVPREEAAWLLVDFDRVLGLDLAGWPQKAREVGEDIRGAQLKRHSLRMRARWREADCIRESILSRGYEVRDMPGGSVVLRRSRAEWLGNPPEISSSREVPGMLEEPDRYDFSVSLVAHNNWPLLERCYESIVRHMEGRHTCQVVIIESGSTDGTREKVLELKEREGNVQVILADHYLGEAASRNATLRQALGSIVLILDAGVEILGDIFTPISEYLKDPSVGAVGAKGLLTKDFQNFHDADTLEVHAVTIYCLAFRRSLTKETGWLDERFRFYRHLDLDFCFKIRSLGYRILQLPELPVVLNPPQAWRQMDEWEIFRRSRANFYIFYRKWHHKRELIHPPGVDGG
jgi:cysteinyl-tRNA synthetase